MERVIVRDYHETMNYDLVERTKEFARSTRTTLKNINLTPLNTGDIKQCLRSSGSVAANFIEANEAKSKQDFLYRVYVCRKEAKETMLWLTLLNEYKSKGIAELIEEANQLTKIFGAILTKYKATSWNK